MKVNELKTGMDAQFAEVRTQFAEVGEQFAKVGEQFANVDERFKTIDEQFADVRLQFEAMDQRITSEAATTRRHFDVVAEDLKSDIRLLAGAIAAMSSTLESHIHTSLSERSTVSAALDDHEVRLTVLERRHV